MTGDIRRIYGNRVSMFGLTRAIGQPGGATSTAQARANYFANSPDLSHNRNKNGGNR